MHRLVIQRQGFGISRQNFRRTLKIVEAFPMPIAAELELPTYELMGFPITPHQFSVLGSANVQEASRAPTLMLRGMPASPHQIAVLTPHKKGLAANSTQTSVHRGATD